MQSKKPTAILISDVHYSLQTLEVADTVVRMAIEKANNLGITLIIAGDLHDTKAYMRAEVVSKMIDTFSYAQDLSVPVVILRGNHDSVNEKSKEHALRFLEGWATEIVSAAPVCWTRLDTHVIPYYHDVEELRAYLKEVPKGSTLIMHQGIKGSNSGEYIQDHSALYPEDVASFRVVSGHYHQRQTIKLPENGTWDYIGNPYSLNFGEANDPAKGFQILYDDGSLEFVPTDLREHKILNYTTNEVHQEAIFLGKPEDTVWVKITGSKEELTKMSKGYIAGALDITQDFRLDLIPTDVTIQEIPADSLDKPHELLDKAIETAEGLTIETKQRLQSLWKGLQS